MEKKSKKINSQKWIAVDGEYIPAYMLETKEHVIDWIKRDIADLAHMLKTIQTDEDWEDNIDILSNAAYRLHIYTERLRNIL